jgi:anaerobic sulfite reductase subunit C
MQWTIEAEEAVKKIPFFVRGRVRARVEEEARQAGKLRITLAEVKTTQQRYLTGMAAEIKGYQLDTCFGPAGCPNRIVVPGDLPAGLEHLLQGADLLGFLKSLGIAELKFHHELRVSVADCPNACSQPQIKDIGIIAACRPRVGEAACSACEACVAGCRESALRLPQTAERPDLDAGRCLACGQCLAACPTGTLAEGARGYRVQLGGKLGRHPCLAREMPGIYDTGAVLEIVQAAIDLYKANAHGGERFGEVLQAADFDGLVGRFRHRALTA